MHRLFPALIASLALSSLAVPSQALVITRTFDYVGSSISTFVGPDSPPLSMVNITFTVTFDPTLAYSNQTAGITLDASNLLVDSPFAFSYFPTSGQRMAVGGSLGGPLGISVVRDDFTIDFNGAAGMSPTVSVMQFSTAASGDSAFRALSNKLTVSDPVPEPATWAMMIAGFGLVGGTLRRRRAGVAHA